MINIHQNKTIFLATKYYGFIGGAIRSFSGNNVNVVSKVKSKPLQGALNQSLEDYNALRTSGQQALGDYIKDYMSNAADAKTFGNQEEGAVSDFFNGNLSNRLAALRTSRQQAVNNAADVGAQQAIRASNGADVADEGGGSSYQTRQLIGAVAPIRAQAAVDNANQERADLGFTTEGQMTNIGKRNDIINRTSGFGLVPQQTARSMFGQNEGFLGNMLQADQLNHFYGLKQQANPWADFADSADQGIMNAASIYSSVAGGGMKDGGLVRTRYATGGQVDAPYPGESEADYMLRKYGIDHQYSGAQLDTAGSGPVMAKKGGKINGPGTGTSDSIPIRVSDGEFIMPAKAVKMPGVLPLLEKIRQMALKGSAKPKGGKDGRHFADGGSFDFSAIGNAMGQAGGSGAFGDAAAMGSGNAAASAAPAKKSMGGGGGGGGGGLSGAASGLQARVDRNLMAQWFPSSSTFGTEAAPAFDAPGADSPWFNNRQPEGALA